MHTSRGDVDGSYNQSVRRILLLRAGLCRRSWRLSRLRRRLRHSGSRARRRGVHEDLISHPKTDLLALVHVEVMGALVRLVFPQPHLLRFVAEAGAKDGSVATQTPVTINAG